VGVASANRVPAVYLPSCMGRGWTTSEKALHWFNQIIYCSRSFQRAACISIDCLTSRTFRRLLIAACTPNTECKGFKNSKSYVTINPLAGLTLLYNFFIGATTDRLTSPLPLLTLSLYSSFGCCIINVTLPSWAPAAACSILTKTVTGNFGLLTVPNSIIWLSAFLFLVPAQLSVC
jgi:hypothetical protein